MQVLAFNGSPHVDGNTAILIETVFKELKKENIETELIHVGKKQLQGCIACMKCWENKDGHCVIKNDMVNECLDKMKNADGIILGSPVYCAGLNSQIKAFMDRTSMVSCANDDLFRHKVGGAVVAVRRAGGVFTFNSLNNYFTILQMIIVGSTYWNMGFGMEKGEVNQDEEGLQTMKNLGRSMAWLIKSIKIANLKEPDTKREARTNFIR